MGAQGLAPTLHSQCHALLFKGPSQKWEGLNPVRKSQREEAAAGGTERQREIFIYLGMLNVCVNYEGAFILLLLCSVFFWHFFVQISVCHILIVFLIKFLIVEIISLCSLHQRNGSLFLPNYWSKVVKYTADCCLHSSRNISYNYQ